MYGKYENILTISSAILRYDRLDGVMEMEFVWFCKYNLDSFVSLCSDD